MKFIKRSYWQDNGHRPYRNLAHTVGENGTEVRDGEPFDKEINRQLEALPEGTEFEIVIRPTGRVVPGYWGYVPEGGVKLLEGSPPEYKGPGR